MTVQKLQKKKEKKKHQKQNHGLILHPKKIRGLSKCVGPCKPIISLCKVKKVNEPKNKMKCESELSTVFPQTHAPWGALGGLALCPIRHGGGPGWSTVLLSRTSPLTGVPVLLVAHQRAVVAEDIHGVLPVPAGATVILETCLKVTSATFRRTTNLQKRKSSSFYNRL